jgi:sugar lactone lactonase YvrE
LIRFDPETALGENLTQVYGGVGIGSTSGSTWGMVFDANDPNILYFTVDEMNRIYKLDFTALTCTTFCGGTAGYFDGPINQAQFSNPHQMCRDSEGNLYVADTGNHCIRKINMKTGYVSTVAGLPQQAGYVNGTGEVAKFNSPCGLAIDNEDVLYVGDSNNHAIRRVAVE